MIKFKINKLNFRILEFQSLIIEFDRWLLLNSINIYEIQSLNFKFNHWLYLIVKKYLYTWSLIISNY